MADPTAPPTPAPAVDPAGMPSLTDTDAVKTWIGRQVSADGGVHIWLEILLRLDAIKTALTPTVQPSAAPSAAPPPAAAPAGAATRL